MAFAVSNTALRNQPRKSGRRLRGRPHELLTWLFWFKNCRPKSLGLCSRKMVSKACFQRAKTILKKKEVTLLTEFIPTEFKFEVKQRSGKIANVTLRRHPQGFMEWSCDALSGNWGCSMHTGDRTKPYCSHSLAAKLFLDNWLKERREMK